MRIKYRIKFTVSDKMKGRTGLIWTNVIEDSPFGYFLARINSFDGGDASPTEKARAAAVNELLVGGKQVVLTSDAYNGVPYVFPSHNQTTYLPSHQDEFVDLDVEIEENPEGLPNVNLVMKTNGHIIYFTRARDDNGRIYFYIPAFTGDFGSTFAIGEVLDYFVSTHAEPLADDFIRKLGTANYTKLRPGCELPIYGMENSSMREETTEDNKDDDIPNHLLHGHDVDPIVHPPMSRSLPGMVEDSKISGEPASEETGENFPFDPCLLYRAAAIAVSKLDLVAIIKAQRTIFEQSKYWKDITRQKLEEDLMSRVLTECDKIAGMIRSGDAENALRMERRVGPPDTRPFKLVIRGDVTGSYLFKIMYVPLVSSGIIAEAEKA